MLPEHLIHQVVTVRIDGVVVNQPSGSLAKRLRPDHAGDDAAVFASALRRLFALAGAPTVRAVAEAIGVSAATVSNWRTGRHLPAEFETIEPMPVWLTARATTDPDVIRDDVVTVRQWQHLFTTATAATPHSQSSRRSRPPPSAGQSTQTPRPQRV